MTADKLIQKLTDEIGVKFPLGQGRPFRAVIETAIQEARNEALEEAVYAAWGALPAASGVIEEVAQAIRALKVGE